MILSIEKMSLSLFTYFLDLLNESRDAFLRQVSQQIYEHMNDILSRRNLCYKYEFEEMNADFLKAEPHDSPAFLQFSKFNKLW